MQLPCDFQGCLYYYHLCCPRIDTRMRFHVMTNKIFLSKGLYRERKDKYICNLESCKPNPSGDGDTSKEQISDGTQEGHDISMPFLKSD